MTPPSRDSGGGNDSAARDDERRAFVEALLPEPAPGEGYVAARHVPPTLETGDGDFEQRRCSSADALLAYLANQADRAATYVALATFPNGSRRSANAAARRNVLSADLDDKNLPGESGEERHQRAIEIAASVPVPKVIVDSGNGVHVHLLLPPEHRVVPGENADTLKAQFERLGIALRRYLEHEIADRFGHETKLDSTHGVERVWRVPGGFNCKAGPDTRLLTSDRSLWMPVRLVTPIQKLTSLVSADIGFLLPFVGDDRPGPGPAESGGRAERREKFHIAMLPAHLQGTWPMPTGDQSRNDFAVAAALRDAGLGPFVAYVALVARRSALPDAEDRAKGEREDYLQRTVDAAFRQDRGQTGNSKDSGGRPDRTEAASLPPWPERMAEAAFHGLGGAFIRLVEPHTEADPAALLVQFLAAFGSAVGRGPHFRTEGDRHYTKINAVIVGRTSKGRKGVSWGRVRQVLARVDPGWAEKCVGHGLSSGEGLIWAVRDPIYKKVAVKKSGRIVDYEEQMVDEGVDDKRLLVLEAEFATPLKVVARDGNTLSPIIRNAWDQDDLRSMTKNSPAKATGAHISIVGHITKHECLRLMTTTEAANGFGNRFLWVCTKRSKLLPEGGALDDAEVESFAMRVREVVAFAQQQGELRRDETARRLWYEVYPELSEGKPGMLGAMTGRAEAQVMRLAMLYALLDMSPEIREPHLRAALAVWDYCAMSAAHIFGERLGDPFADEVLRAIRASEAGMTRTELRDYFAKHASKHDMDRALAMLKELGAVDVRTTETGGRPAEVWFATEQGCDRSDESDQSPPSAGLDAGSQGGSVALVASVASPAPPDAPAAEDEPADDRVGGREPGADDEPEREVF